VGPGHESGETEKATTEKVAAQRGSPVGIAPIETPREPDELFEPPVAQRNLFHQQIRRERG